MQLQIAKKMLQRGESIDIIAEDTGLTPAEIAQLKANECK